MTDPKNRAREQGVALMMTLGILSLILILAMSFSFTARTGRMLSENNADMVRSRLVAEGTLDRVIASLDYTFDPKLNYGTPATRDRVFPATSSVGWFAQTTSLYKNRYFRHSQHDSDNDDVGIEQALAYVPSFPNGDDFPFLPEMGSVPTGTGWEHVKGYRKQPDGSYREELLARTCFLVVDESYKIDPCGVLSANEERYWDTQPADGATTTYNWFDANNDGKYNSDFLPLVSGRMVLDEGTVKRPGYSPEEIRLYSGVPNFAQYFRQELPLVGAAGGKVADWFSWSHIAAGINNSTYVLTTSNAPDALETYFPYSHDVEAYRLDPANGPDYHRMNIWEDVDWDNTTWDQPALEALYATGPKFFAANGTIDTSATCASAPALGQFFADDGTTNISINVLANLVDFCDSNDYATIIPNGDEWTATTVGNEEQPYVNEVGFISTYYKSDPDAVPDSGDESGYFSVCVLVELANIYSTPRTVSGIARVEFSLTGSGTASHDFLISETVPARSYKVVSASWGEDYEVGTAVPNQITFQVTKCRVVLYSGGTEDADHVADISVPVEADALTATITGTGLAPQTWYATSQVEDPRCNTLNTEWTTTDFALSSSLTMDSISLSADTPPVVTATGKLNANTDATAGDDGESLPDPIAGLSTAYIGNYGNYSDTGKGISFWALGAVHRGEPWRTINLKAYSDGAVRKYSDGDAILLDQLKLGGQFETRGRVNANSPCHQVWYQLLDGLTIGADYDDPGGTGSAITGMPGMSTTIANLKKDPTNTWLSRGQFATLAALTDDSCGTTQGTDCLREELIGKLANLLTVRQNIFTVLVTAQTVKDTGINDAKKHNTITYDGGTNYCNILSEQRLLATVFRDAFTNELRIVRMEYLGE